MDPQKVFTPDKPVKDEDQIPAINQEYKARSLSSQPYGANQAEPPTPPPKPVVSANSSNSKWSKLRKGPVIAGIIGGIVVITLLIVALLAGGDKKPTQNQAASTNNTQAEALKPAQSIELEKTSNSLSQDLSRLDDERDLPNNSLEDTTLGL